MKMEFQIGGRKISLRGSQPGTSKVVGGHQMEKLLNKSDSLSTILVADVQPIDKGVACLNSKQLEVPGELHRLSDQFSRFFERDCYSNSQSDSLFTFSIRYT